MCRIVKLLQTLAVSLKSSESPMFFWVHQLSAKAIEVMTMKVSKGPKFPVVALPSVVHISGAK